MARMQAKSQLGKGIASLSGLGELSLSSRRRVEQELISKGMSLGFLAIAAARWTSYTPPPTLEQNQAPIGATQQASRQV